MSFKRAPSHRGYGYYPTSTRTVYRFHNRADYDDGRVKQLHSSDTPVPTSCRQLQTFRSDMKLAAKEANSILARTIMRQAAAEGFGDDLYLWTSLLKAHSPHLDEARDIFFNDMLNLPLLDVWACTEMLCAFAFGRCYDDVPRVEVIMKERNIKPDRQFFNTMIKCCGEACQPETELQRILQMMADASILPDNHIDTQLAVLNYYGCVRDTKTATAKFYQLARRHDAQGPMSELYGHVMKAFRWPRNHEELRKAETLFEEYRDEFQNQKQNHFVWTTMISIYVDCCHYEEALSLFQTMKCSQYVQPNYVTYSIIMKAYERMANETAATELLAEMSQKGMKLDSYVIDSLRRLDDKVSRADAN